MYARLGMLVLAVAVSVIAPARVEAQQAAPAQQPAPVQQAAPAQLTAPVRRAAPAHGVSTAGPRLDLTATAIRRPAIADSTDAGALMARKQNMGRPVALMIVGGSAFILGAVIGGDAGTIFMIGGAVTGLIGLYQYLQ